MSKQPVDVSEVGKWVVITILAVGAVYAAVVSGDKEIAGALGGFAIAVLFLA